LDARLPTTISAEQEIPYRTEPDAFQEEHLWGVGDDTECAFAKRPGSLSEKESTVDSSRIGNQELSISAQEFLKGLNFFLNYRFVCSHVIHLQLDPLK
jgi:hypothetical protein